MEKMNKEFEEMKDVLKKSKLEYHTEIYSDNFFEIRVYTEIATVNIDNKFFQAYEERRDFHVITYEEFIENSEKFFEQLKVIK